MSSTTLNIHSKVKLNNGVEMPVFGLGMYLSESGDDLVSTVAYALSKAKYIMLDSAKCYRNEVDVGRGIKASGVPRQNVFVTTKLYTTKDGRQGAIDAVEDSLKLMDIGYIDQYLLHCPQGGHILAAYDVLLEYEQKGLIRSVGVSNFGVEHLEALKNSGRPLPVVNQIEFHPWCTQEAIVQWCRAHNVAVVGYSPLAQANRLSEPLVLDLAKKYGKTAAQVLVRYSLQSGVITIPKSTKSGRIDENAAVFDFALSSEEMAAFDALGKGDSGRVCWNPTKNDLATEFGPTK